MKSDLVCVRSIGAVLHICGDLLCWDTCRDHLLVLGINADSNLLEVLSEMFLVEDVRTD